jgi:bifunctional DNA-binding transcriptional regulator/antitoxin component of YhaV-PrlF toxin-antitoxin module
MNAIATKTSRGQDTIPRRHREVLNSRLIEFDVQDDVVMVRPVRSVAGGLAKYAKKPRPLSEVRDEVWKEVVNEKVQGRPS